VQFVNAVKPDLKLGEPLRDVTEDGRTYRLYRVADRFKNSLEFHDFPFDHERLTVLLQNRTQTVCAVAPTPRRPSTRSRLGRVLGALLPADGRQQRRPG
jgi:hypothetical protein